MEARLHPLFLFLLVAANWSGAASACMLATFAPKLEKFRSADLVVVGRIARYEPLYDSPGAPPGALVREWRRNFAVDGYMGEHARVEILVDQVLVGRAPRRLRATWGPAAASGMLAEPPSGRLLIGLHSLRRLRPSDPMVWPTVIQPGCSAGLVLDDAGGEAEAVRRMLGVGERRTIADALSSPAALLGNAAIALLGLAAWLLAAGRRRWRRWQAARAPELASSPAPGRKGGVLAAVARRIGPASLD